MKYIYEGAIIPSGRFYHEESEPRHNRSVYYQGQNALSRLEERISTMYSLSTQGLELTQQDLLLHIPSIILTIGSAAAARATDLHARGDLILPALGLPDYAELTDEQLADLAGYTVVLLLPVEQREDPFTPSPGEQWTIAYGEALTGRGMKRQLKEYEQSINDATNLSVVALERLQQQIADLRTRQKERQSVHGCVKVVRLPRNATERHVDLASFLDRPNGITTLNECLLKAVDFRTWYDAHATNHYWYGDGGIWEQGDDYPKLLANYWALVTEDVNQHDGREQTSAHVLEIQTPSGRRRTAHISGKEWADQRTAMIAIRQAVGEATVFDEGPAAFKAIKMLSRYGDDPVRRDRYTCTGWEQIGGRWHFLMPDGAVTAAGIMPHCIADLDAYSQGNHYALCGSGDAAGGAAAYLGFLSGEVCRQDLALLLAGHAALAPLMRFVSDGGKPLLWLYGESGVHKTALVRAAVLAPFGPKFTAVRDDGAPIPKWNSTKNALELIAFTYRDVPLCIDDYKQAIATRDTLATFIHDYSEGTSRNRMTRDRKLDRVFLPRCLAISTGEDRPDCDTGQDARIIDIPITKARNSHHGDVNTEALTRLQAAGAAGNVAAFWRGYVQWIATKLDAQGVDSFSASLRAQLQSDDEDLPGHRRVAGALRSNRLGLLMLLSYMEQQQLVMPAEAALLREAHLHARDMFAQRKAEQNGDIRPSAIFLDILREGLTTGAIGLADGTDSHVSVDRLIGFRYDREGSVALYPQRTYQYVVRTLHEQNRNLNYSERAILQQLNSDGAFARTSESGYTVQVRYGGKRHRVWLIRKEYLIDSVDEWTL